MTKLPALLSHVALVAGTLTTHRPQMGWNSWNTFKLNFNQSTIESMADLLVSTGLRDAGYNYLVLDDGWQEITRDSDGRQQWNSTKFPAGSKAIIDYVHERELKFGLYSDAGIYDCAFFPGSWGNEELDANTYAEWGVDYLKYDNCGLFHAGTESPQVRFNVMRDALLNSGRDIYYSICQWGWQFPWYWVNQTAPSYRMSGDITAVFSDQGKDCACKTAYCLNTGYAGCSVLTIIRKMREIAPFQKPGSFADMDMLEIGVANMTLEEQRTHMSFWAALKSPLVIGADLRKLSNDSLSVLLNKDAIAVSHDELGQAVLYKPELSEEYRKQVWAGPLSGSRTVLLVFNELNATATIEVPFSSVGQVSGNATAHEVWSGERLSIPQNGSVSATFAAHETKMYIM